MHKGMLRLGQPFSAGCLAVFADFGTELRSGQARASTVCWTDKGGDRPLTPHHNVPLVGEALVRLQGLSLLAAEHRSTKRTGSGSFEFQRHDPLAAQSHRLRCQCRIHGALR